MQKQIQAIRCDHDGLKMAEIKDGHLILRSKHHGETHVKIVALGELGREGHRTYVNEDRERAKPLSAGGKQIRTRSSL